MKPVNGVDPDEAPNHPAWKAKKWVAEISTRIYTRYGDAMPAHMFYCVMFTARLCIPTLAAPFVLLRPHPHSLAAASRLRAHQLSLSSAGDPKLVPKDHMKFAQQFNKEYSLKMLQLHIEMLAAFANGTAYVTPRVANASLQYIDNAWKYPSTYKVMKGQAGSVVQVGLSLDALLHDNLY